MNIIVIGGGPAGILSAISAAKHGNNVTILEKNDTLGKKLLITGKGRCNITSSLDMSEFINNIPGNGKFLYSAFQNFTNQDIISLLKKEGLNVKQERGNRIFPVTDNAQDVLNALLNKCRKLNIQIKTNIEVKEILVKENNVLGVRGKNTKTNQEQVYNAEKIILATGGMSYPGTGSTGDGYKMAKSLGHTIIPVKGSLVPLVLYFPKMWQDLQGLSLRNVKIQIKDETKQKVIYEDFGEMLFTHFGISGPIILSASAHLLRYKNIEQLLDEEKISIEIDLKPALTEETLDARILRDFEKNKNKLFKNSLDELLPKKMIYTVIKQSKINPEKSVNEITKVERQNLVKILKKIKFTIQGFRDVNEAIVTSGGINIKEINPKTMESKIIKGLFFAGEIIDVDAYTGGFNLQIAFSSGYTAGMN